MSSSSSSLVTSVVFAAIALVAVAFTAEASPEAAAVPADGVAVPQATLLASRLLDDGETADAESFTVDMPLTAVAVPEPPTYALAMVAGVLGAGIAARRRAKRA